MSDLSSRIQELAQRQGWTAKDGSDGTLHVAVVLPNDRHQTVKVEEGKDGEQDDIVWFRSTAGEQSAMADEAALLGWSATLAYGGVAIQDGQVLIKHTMRTEAADDISVAKAIYHVAATADALEAQNFGEDRN
jgi:hypothetical protein